MSNFAMDAMSFENKCNWKTMDFRIYSTCEWTDISVNNPLNTVFFYLWSIEKLESLTLQVHETSLVASISKDLLSKLSKIF